VTGVGATAGTIAIALGVGGPAAAGAVALWIGWKAGMALWDRSRGYKAPVEFPARTREQRVRLHKLHKLGYDPDKANIEHRLYVEHGIGPYAAIDRGKMVPQ
jgi:hypothetical protein